jgi:hypothetical protein
MWHTFRPFLQRHAKRLGVSVKSGGAYKKFAFYTDAQKASRTSAMKSYREMLLRARDLCVEEASRMGAGELELSEVLQEVSHGR